MPLTQFPAAVDVSALTGKNGFALTGFTLYTEGHLAVSGCGDINGDGIPDLAIVVVDNLTNTGISYVIFGKAGLAQAAHLTYWL